MNYWFNVYTFLSFQSFHLIFLSIIISHLLLKTYGAKVYSKFIFVGGGALEYLCCTHVQPEKHKKGLLSETEDDANRN